MSATESSVRLAGVTDALAVATLLDAFNREFATPSPGVEVLAERVRALLPSGNLVALLAGAPPVAVALVTFRPSVWFEGPAAMLEELYVRPAERNRGVGGALLDAAVADATGRGAGTFEINVDESDVDAQRFYEAHGFRSTDADSGDRMFFYYRDL